MSNTTENWPRLSNERQIEVAQQHIASARQAAEQLRRDLVEVIATLDESAKDPLNSPFPRSGISGDYHLINAAANTERHLTAAMSLLGQR